MTMKIGDLDSTYATGTNYSFQYDPKIVNMTIGSKKQLISLPLVSVSSYLDNEAVTPLMINLVGTVYGSTKVTLLNQLSSFMMSKGMKKLYLDSTHFVYVLGKGMKPTKDGKKYNFRDYVASFECPIPFIYGTTANTYVITDLDDTATTLNDATANSTGAFANTGYGPAHITHIQLAVQAGSANMKEFSFGDKALSGGAVAGDNILTWSDSTGIAAGETLHVYLIYEYGSKGNLWYCFKDSTDETVIGDRDLSGDNRGSGPRVDGLQTDQDFSIKIDDASTNVDVTFTNYNSNYGGF